MAASKGPSTRRSPSMHTTRMGERAVVARFTAVKVRGPKGPPSRNGPAVSWKTARTRTWR